MRMDSSPLMEKDRAFFYYNDLDWRSKLRKLLITFTIILFVATLLMIILPSDEESEVYSYYLFTRRWPPITCAKANKCIPEAKNYVNWTIHGLWPEFSNNTWNQFCRKDHLDPDKLQPIRSALEQEWPNLLKGKDPTSLWEHEWTKHGTCTEMSEFDYFNRTLALHREFALTEWLEKGGIVPSPTRVYHVDDLRGALSSHFDVKSMTIDCETYSKQAYLSEIWFCFNFDKSERQFVPTACTMESTCKNSFLYVPFGTVARPRR